MAKHGDDYHFDEKVISVILDFQKIIKFEELLPVALPLFRRTCQRLPYVNEDEGGCSDHGWTSTRDKITV